MNCPNCGTTNNVGSKFCIKCGQSLAYVQSSVEQSVPHSESLYQEIPIQNMNSNPIQSENNFETNIASTQSRSTNNVSSAEISFMDYFFIILAVILKPFTAFKEELNKFNNLKNSAIMSLIVSGISTLIKLITTILNSIMVKSYNWSSGGYKTTWNWDNLKEIEYLKVVGKNFLIYLGIIVAIAVVYYIASLIVKKQTNFSKLLGISAIAVTPMLVCSLIISPLLSLIISELAMPITIIGAVYTIVLIYEGMNNEVLIEGNLKYYFNLVCLSILGIAAYYLYIKIFTSSISGGIKDILNLFG